MEQEKQKLQEHISQLERRLEESRNVANLRRLEQQLSETQASFEEYKRQEQQAREALERRFRDEMKELQSGSDDTAEAWLEKHRAAQQEIDRLHAAVEHLKAEHARQLETLQATHEAQIREWKAKCETNETEIENQAHQIESLLVQVDDLQNSLEAATARLEEHTSASKKSSFEGLSMASSSTEAHRVCEEKLQARQRDLEELQRRISELKESHETQLNRLGYEKARELQDLRREMQGFQELLEATKTVNEVLGKQCVMGLHFLFKKELIYIYIGTLTVHCRATQEGNPCTAEPVSKAD